MWPEGQTLRVTEGMDSRNRSECHWLWPVVRMVKPRLVLERAGIRIRAGERQWSGSQDSGVGTFLLFAHRIADS